MRNFCLFINVRQFFHLGNNFSFSSSYIFYHIAYLRCNILFPDGNTAERIIYVVAIHQITRIHIIFSIHAEKQREEKSMLFDS